MIAYIDSQNVIHTTEVADKATYPKQVVVPADVPCSAGYFEYGNGKVKDHIIIDLDTKIARIAKTNYNFDWLKRNCPKVHAVVEQLMAL